MQKLIAELIQLKKEDVEKDGGTKGKNVLLTAVYHSSTDARELALQHGELSVLEPISSFVLFLNCLF